LACSATSSEPETTLIVGAASWPASPHAHVLRNQSVGSTCRVAASGPRFSTVIRMHKSVGAAFA
jgi:hypothetical protein